MRLLIPAVLAATLLACNRGTPPPSAPVGPASGPVRSPVVLDTEPSPLATEAPAAPSTPSAPSTPTIVAPDEAGPGSKDAAALYAECEQRLEQPEADGECTTDADCVTAGCSSERCIAKASAEGLMGTCEMLPCFEVVDTCGCVDGRCSWSLKP